MLISKLKRFPEDGLIILTHVPKAGGTSLVDLLCDFFGEDKCFRHRARLPGTDTYTPGIEDLNEFEKEKIKFISGHIEYGYHKLFKQRCYYIGVVRDPVERVVSNYYHLKVRGKSKHKELANSMTLEEFALHLLSMPKSMFSHNYQIKLLTGETSLRKAKSRIKNEFLLACTTSQLDKFQRVLQDFFNVADQKILKSNATNEVIKGIELSNGTIQKIKEATKTDIAFIKHIETSFDKHINLITKITA